ncbi:type II secretion system GspH family protein [Shewanella sp. NIFS-20-20]|nr:type II secretion system GspH family protein [Shewanella sp. NIFS-20-20]
MVGFTLIELVVVLIIVGILAVVAVPKFISLGDEAERSALLTDYSAFASAVSLYHDAWLVLGEGQAVARLANFGQGNVSSTATGFPYSTSGIDTDVFNACLQVWHGLIQSDITLAYVTDADIPSTHIQLGYTYTTNACIYRGIYFIQQQQSTPQMTYYFDTGKVIIRDAFYDISQ